MSCCKPPQTVCGMDPHRRTSQVVKQSCAAMMNHGCDLTDDAQGNASLENPLASMPISAMLSGDQCGALWEEDDRFWQTIARAISVQ